LEKKETIAELIPESKENANKKNKKEKKTSLCIIMLES